MNFLSPGRLVLLLVVAALAGLYVWIQRRRRHAAVRYTNLAVLAEVAPANPGWRRHVPAAIFRGPGARRRWRPEALESPQGASSST